MSGAGIFDTALYTFPFPLLLQDSISISQLTGKKNIPREFPTKQADLCHIDGSAYCCFLPDLTRSQMSIAQNPSHREIPRDIVLVKNSEPPSGSSLKILWRRAWDSNPRGCYALLAFQASSLATRSTLHSLPKSPLNYNIGVTLCKGQFSAFRHLFSA